VPLRATSRVHWHVDGQRVEAADWALVPGRHIITATNDSGDRDEVRIYVK
jgi:membrane carboxypeptidase/penicillin-binding protein PbpC